MKLAAMKGQYLLAATADHKQPFLLKVSGISGSTISGVVEKDCHIQELRSVVDIDDKDVFANLGDEPYRGKAFGVDTVQIYRGNKHHDKFGVMYYFYRPSKEVYKGLSASLDKTYNILKKHRLDSVLNDRIIWEIAPYHKEKYAGWYKAKRSEQGVARIQFKPESLPATEYPYVILHELSHHLHFEYLVNEPKLEAQWIKLYNTSIKVETISRQVSEQLLQGLLDGEDSPSHYKGLLEEDLQLSYTWVLRTIKANHNLSVKELDKLFENDMTDEIVAVWPSHFIKKKDLAPVVSTYSTKNFKELIAEAFAFYLLGKKLPKHVVKLVEKSLSYIKTQLEN